MRPVLCCLGHERRASLLWLLAKLQRWITRFVDDEQAIHVLTLPLFIVLDLDVCQLVQHLLVAVLILHKNAVLPDSTLLRLLKLPELGIFSLVVVEFDTVVYNARDLRRGRAISRLLERADVNVWSVLGTLTFLAHLLHHSELLQLLSAIYFVHDEFQINFCCCFI